MDLTKRMKFALLQRFILNSILFIIFVLVLIFYLSPKIFQYEEKKKELSAVVQEIFTTNQSGLKFGDFKAIAQKQGLVNDSYSQQIIDKVNISFFEQNFENTLGGQYSAFLDKKSEEISPKQQDPNFLELQKTIDILFPIYSEKKLSDENTLSDAYFINSIENLLYNFRLNHTGDIGIGVINKIENYEVSREEIGQSDPLKESIYAIPIDLTVTGRKSDIVDFIHYFEHLGDATIDYEKQNISLYSDDFISKSITNRFSNKKNLYLSQFADIQKISLAEYPDSSPIQTQMGFIERLKIQQGNEKYSAKITLMFYVTGYPGYKIEEAGKKMREAIIAGAELLGTDIQNYLQDTEKKQNKSQLDKVYQRLNDLSIEVQEYSSENLDDTLEFMEEKYRIYLALYDTGKKLLSVAP